MSIQVPCACGQQFWVSDGMAGRHATCPACGKTIAIAATAAPSRSAAVQPRPTPPPPTPSPVPPTRARSTPSSQGFSSETVLWIAGGAVIAVALVAAVIFLATRGGNSASLGPAVVQATEKETPRQQTHPERAPEAGKPDPTLAKVVPVDGPGAKQPGVIEVPMPAREEAFLSDRPTVEVVFCLDTTSSMDRLLEGAKQKIWAISSQVLTGRPTPALKIGLVAYRDKKDEYVTQVHDLTEDLDAMNSHLKEFKAGGGGDTPESVNQGLDDAVNKIKWSTTPDTMRLIFLVGDAEGHMDYKDDVKYPETCKKAVEKGILINTVQCGNSKKCREQWLDICKLGGGQFVEIPQTGGVKVVDTPFDAELVELNRKFTESILVYGDAATRKAGERKVDEALKLSAASGAADRAAYVARNGRVAPYDLIDAIRDKRVKLESLPDNQLPPAMKGMTPAEKREFLAKVEKTREEWSKRALELDRKRTEHLSKSDTNKAFDNQVLEILRKQAADFRIVY